MNWKVRFNNPQWVTAFVAQLLVIAELIVAGGHQIGLWNFVWVEEINRWALAVVNAALLALSMLGIVQDPTTKGFTDSEAARTYKKPREHI